MPVPPLLGRGIFRRDETQVGARRHRSDIPCTRVEELRDAEVQQFHDARLRHEDIRGLEVAVNDEGAMRVLDRVAHHAKQAQPSLERKTLSGAPFADRNAVDELHHQIRSPIGREAAVEQTRDVGMGQLCEHLSLGTKAIDGVGVARARSEDLDSHFLSIVAVCALGAIDGTHAAASENADQAPRPEAAADQGTDVSSLECPIDDESFDGQGAIGAGGRQHRFDLITQRHIGATRLGQKPSARLNGLGVRELEKLLDPLPVHAVHDPSSSDRVKRLCDWTRDQSCRPS